MKTIDKLCINTFPDSLNKTSTLWQINKNWYYPVAIPQYLITFLSFVSLEFIFSLFEEYICEEIQNLFIRETQLEFNSIELLLNS